MTLETTIASDLQKLITDLRSAEQRADDKLRGINIRAARDLLRLARSVVHVQSGRLQGSLHVEGPFNIGTGTLEARVTSNVPYASEEIARGSEHDYATRTLTEGASIIEQAAQDMEKALIAIMEGRA